MGRADRRLRRWLKRRRQQKNKTGEGPVLLPWLAITCPSTPTAAASEDLDSTSFDKAIQRRRGASLVPRLEENNERGEGKDKEGEARGNWRRKRLTSKCPMNSGNTTGFNVSKHFQGGS